MDLGRIVNPVPIDKFSEIEINESSNDIRKRVIEARRIQYSRSGQKNSNLNEYGLQKYCELSKESKKVLIVASKKMNISARSYTRIQKIARTIADLDNSEKIESNHLAEAMQYRTLDKMNQFLN